MKTLNLTNSSKLIYIDDEDYDRCCQYKWRLSTSETGILSTVCIGKNQISIQNYIMRNRKIVYDHADRSVFNNQKNNLRPCNKSQNSANRDKCDRYKGPHSPYKGVTLCRGKWMAQMGGKNHQFLGYFPTQEAAARAYDKAAIKLFGEFARTNFNEDAQ